MPEEKKFPTRLHNRLHLIKRENGQIIKHIIDRPEVFERTIPEYDVRGVIHLKYGPLTKKITKEVYDTEEKAWKKTRIEDFIPRKKKLDDIIKEYDFAYLESIPVTREKKGNNTIKITHVTEGYSPLTSLHSGMGVFEPRNYDDHAWKLTMRLAEETENPAILVIHPNRREFDSNRKAPNNHKRAVEYYQANREYLFAKAQLKLAQQKDDAKEIRSAKEKVFSTLKHVQSFRVDYPFFAKNKDEYKYKRKALAKLYELIGQQTIGRKPIINSYIHSYGPNLNPSFNGFVIPLNMHMSKKDMQKVALVSEYLNQAREYSDLLPTLRKKYVLDQINARKHILRKIKGPILHFKGVLHEQDENFLRTDLRVLGLKEGVRQDDFLDAVRKKVKGIAEKMELISTSDKPFQSMGYLDEEEDVVRYGDVDHHLKNSLALEVCRSSLEHENDFNAIVNLIHDFISVYHQPKKDIRKLISSNKKQSKKHMLKKMVKRRQEESDEK